LPLGVIGNTSDFDSEEFRFDPWRGIHYKGYIMSKLLEDSPYFDELVNGDVGSLQNALFEADMDEEANIIEQIMWKLVDSRL
jgi:hypothetical protein